MSATNKERENFISELTRALPDYQPFYSAEVARRLLRYAATLQRLSEAQCNGDYPADNGERKVVACSRCECLWVRSSMVIDHTREADNGWRPLICKDCRLQDLVTALLQETPLMPIFGGDPRGYVLKLAPRGAAFEDIDCGRIRGIGVPS